LLFHHDFINITPHPILARLERPHDRVSSGAEMFRGVLVLRGITATDVSAGHTKAEMNPLITGFQALFAALGARLNLTDLF